MRTVIIEVTLSTPAEAVDSNDVLAATQEIEGFFPDLGASAQLRTVELLDEADQGVALDLVFLRTNVALGAEDAAVSISDTNAREIATIVSITAADYVDLVGCQHASVEVNRSMKAADTSRSIFLAAITRGTPTYAADSLKLKLGVDWP